MFDFSIFVNDLHPTLTIGLFGSSASEIAWGGNIGSLITQFYTIYLISGLIGIAIEIWFMKYCRWGSWKVCIGDAVLLNFAAGLGNVALCAVAPRLYYVPCLLGLAILIKGFLTAKLSDLSPRKAWIICTIGTFINYLAAYFSLICISKIWFLFHR
jgi:hypothetical protein